jgi:hypothetical protein
VRECSLPPSPCPFRKRRIPPAAQPGYLMGIRLERYIPEGLRKLGCGGAWNEDDDR